MRKLIATKAGYVRRLRQMLAREKPCGCCPAVVGYELKADHKYQKGQNVCNLCKDFVNLLSSLGCPCDALGQRAALERAQEAIAAWDAGKHHWRSRNPTVAWLSTYLSS